MDYFNFSMLPSIKNKRQLGQLQSARQYLLNGCLVTMRP